MLTGERKPRVLLVTRNLPPLTGGMERLIQQAALGIAEFADLTVIGPTGCAAALPEHVEVFEVPEKLAPFLLLSAARALKLARPGRFDCVIGGSGLCAIAVSLAARRSAAKSILFLHGLDLVVNSALYQRLFLPQIRRADHVISNSNNTLELAVERGIDTSRITLVNPGTTLPDPGTSTDRADFYKRFNLKHEQFIVFVGRMTQRKGLAKFLRECFPAVIAKRPDLGLLVIGHEPSGSLNQRGEESSVLAAVTELGLEQHVTFVGKLSDTDLIEGYTFASAQIFPLRDVAGDVEGFGMVAIEAAACGTPTIAFDVGGVADAVTPQNGYLVAAGDYARFAQCLLEAVEHGKPTASTCREFAKQFAWPVYHDRIRQVIESQLAPGQAV